MSAEKTTASARERRDIEELLPWHAAGTLSYHDAQSVEAALASDPELARRYQLVREELAQTVQLNESLGAPSARAMDALFAKIDAEPARHAASSINLGARVREFFASLSPRTLAWSAAAAALAIVLQAAVIGGLALKQQSSGGFETASSHQTVGDDGSYVVIRFQPQASSADVTKFLETNKLSIAGGPGAGGLYRVRIAATKVSKAELTRTIKTLQIDPVVSLIAAPE
jgi:anti-sigma factor RsiW